MATSTLCGYGSGNYGLEATSNLDLTSTGKYLMIRKSDGTSVHGCGTGTVCDTYGTVAPGDYVARVEDSKGRWLGGSATLTIYPASSGKAPASDAVGGVDLAQVATLYGSASDACLALTNFPGTHTNSSESDQQEACFAAANSGASVEDAIRAAAGGVLAAQVTQWLLQNALQALPAQGSGGSGDYPAPGISAGGNPQTWPIPAYGAQYVLSMAATLEAQNPGLTSVEADDAAAQCARDTAMAGLPATDCTGMPMFVPGRDTPTVTDHDVAAILSTPVWEQLNYQIGTGKSGSGWQTGLCTVPHVVGPGEQCDEYPFFSSEQGGPTPPDGLTPSLMTVNTTDNTTQGGFYSDFIAYCNLQSQPTVNPGTPFLVVPMPSDVGPAGAFPTLSRICNS